MTDYLDRITQALADQYRIEREIGRGGMATVYLAQDLKHDRKVAIKVFSPELAAMLGTERFLQEIRLTANLQHPHIIALYDSGEAGGLLYYVMPYVEGESLRDRLNREKKLPLRDAVRIASQVAAALDYAHRQDVVHRDIKPENIMLHGGAALVADFGIARAAAAAGGERLTATGLAVGTPAYMSPEQASGTQEADRRSDLYSLGCVLYEMLAGDPPFTASTPRQILAKHVVEDAPPIRDAAPEVPTDVAAVVDQLLAKEPEDRFQTAGAFTEAVDAAAVSGVLSTVATGVWQPGGIVRGRVLPVVGAYLLLGVLGVLFTQWLSGRLLLSPYLAPFVAVAMVSLLPAVAVLAYSGGSPKRSRRLVPVAIPINLLVSVVLLLVLFAGKDLGAVTRSVTLEDEAGNVVTRRVAKEGFRKQVALFFFDNPSGDTTLTWLRYGIPWSMAQDLGQDLFITLDLPLEFIDRLREEGYDDGLDMPIALMRSIARDRHMDRLLTGSIERSGGQLLVTTRLYDAERGRLEAERSVIAADPFAAVDELSARLREDLGIPAAHLEETPDVPVSDMLTASLEAYYEAVAGVREILAQDYPTAVQHLDRAVATDSTFAIAHVMRFGVYLALSDPETAEQALERALALSYRVPERMQLAMKAAYYRLVRQDIPKMFAVMRMRVELYPDDLDARLDLALMHANEGRFDSAMAHYERALEIDPSRYELLFRIGQFARAQGQFEDALGYYRQYAEAFPENPRSYRALGVAYRDLGRHQESLDAYERALLLDHTDHGALLGSAVALTNSGRLEEAEERLHEALEASQTASQRRDNYERLSLYHEMRGQMAQAVEYMHLSWAELTELGPFLELQLKLQDLGTYVRAGLEETALDSLESFTEQMPAAFATLIPLGYAVVYFDADDADGLEGTIPGLEEFMERLGVGAIRNFVELARGKVLELRGRCEEALPHYEESLRLNQTEFDLYIHQARCQRTLGDLDAAQENAREYVRLRPYESEGLYELALVLRDEGEQEEALVYARRAMQVLEDADPGFERAELVRVLASELQAEM